MTRAGSASSVTEAPAAAQRSAHSKFFFRLFQGTPREEEHHHSCAVSFAHQAPHPATVYVAAVAGNDTLADSLLVPSSKGHPLMESSHGLLQKLSCFCGGQQAPEACPQSSRASRDNAVDCLELAHKSSSLPIRSDSSGGVMGRSMSFSPKSSSSSSSSSGGGSCGGCNSICVMRTGEDSPGSDSQTSITAPAAMPPHEGVPMAPLVGDASADSCTCHVSTAFAAGGAAGEDRVQAVCSDDGWVFCGIYDGFNGRDAADFLGANLFVNVSKELELSKHTGRLTPQVSGVKPETGPGTCLAGAGRSTDSNVQAQTPEAVCDGLQRAMEATEAQFFATVQANVADRADLVMSGSCAVSALILDGILYVMNLGDSQAVLATADRWQSPIGCSTAEATDAAALQPTAIPEECSRMRTEGSDDLETDTAGASSLSLLKQSQGTLERLGFGAKWQVLADQHWYRHPHSRASLRMGPCGYQQERWKAGLAAKLLMPGVKQPVFKHLAASEPIPQAVLLTESHNVDNEAERERVMREHPEDPRAIVKDRVKGKLRVTRAFGAGYLKHEDLNNALPGIFRVKDLKSDPYVSSKPHVRSHQLSPEDRFVVIGSDGVFDFFTKEEVVELVAHHMNEFPHSDPSTYLLDQVLHRAALMSGVTRDGMRDAQPEKRRKYHDDATVIVIPLNRV